MVKQKSPPPAPRKPSRRASLASVIESSSNSRKRGAASDGDVPRGTSEDAPTEPGRKAEEIRQLPLADIDIGPNVRTVITPASLDELTTSIRRHGVLLPIKVRAEGARWVVITGQRRTMAARLAGLETIPATVETRELAGAALTIEQLVENLQREDMNAMDEADGVRQILEADPALTHDQIGELLGRSRSWVSNALRVAELLVAEGQQAVREGKLTGSQVKPFAGLRPVDQVALVASAVEKRWTTAECERQAKLVQDVYDYAIKAVEALEKNNVPKGATVFLDHPQDYVLEAVADAGWKVGKGHYGEAYRTRPYDAKKLRCECAGTAFVLHWQFKVEAVCVVKSHVLHERQPNVLDAMQEKRRLEEREREAARAERGKLVAKDLTQTFELNMGRVPGEGAVQTLRLVVFALVNSDHTLTTDLIERLHPRAEKGETKKAYKERIAGIRSKGAWKALADAPDSAIAGLLGETVADRLVRRNLYGTNAAVRKVLDRVVVQWGGTPEEAPDHDHPDDLDDDGLVEDDDLDDAEAE